MSNFDYDKIKDMEYDPSRGRYIDKNGSEFRVTPYSDGRGFKYDYYDKTTYENSKHNSTHINSDLNENWKRTDNDRENETKKNSSGSGCYLTTACMKHQQNNFDDNCIELMTLRWFRDNYVTKEDIIHYYNVAPTIVNNINLLNTNNEIYDWIYNNVISPCVNAIKQGNFEFAYNQYKNNVLLLENVFIKQNRNERVFVKTLKKVKNQ